MPYSQLVYHIHRHPNPYQQFSIPKRGGGARGILAPVSALKIIQRKLAQVLSVVYTPRPCALGFVPHGGILKNAEPHAGARWVLNVDLSDFFGSINFGRVRGLFRANPYRLNDEAATVLAQICCHGNALPQGAPTSPVISNMICGRLDGQLLRLAKRYRVHYTRYADDLSFSTRARDFPAALARRDSSGHLQDPIAGEALEAVITANGFSVNPRKTRLQGQAERQEVTGLTVNVRPNVRRTFIRQVRAMLHAWRRYGLEACEIEHRRLFAKRHRKADRPAVSYARVVKGKLDFLGMVRGSGDQLYRDLLRQYAALAPSFRYPFDDTAQSPSDKHLAESLWVLESYDPPGSGTGFVLHDVGLVTCAHVLGRDTVAFRPDRPEKKFRIEVLAREDERLDLAVLALPDVPSLASRGLQPANRRHDIKQGDAIRVAGFPNYRSGDTHSIYRGHVSGFRTWSLIRMIQLDASVIRGMSGGPVLNEQGLVVGIARTGADSQDETGDTEKRGAIPFASIHEMEGLKIPGEAEVD